MNNTAITIHNIKLTGKALDRTLKAMVRDKDLNRKIIRQAETMGATKRDAIDLFDSALFHLVKAVNNETLTHDHEIMPFFQEMVKQLWVQKIAAYPHLQDQVLSFIAKDSDLKKRILNNMIRLNCPDGTAEDYYQDGIVKLKEILTLRKYRGGSIKGFFYKVCENILRNANKRYSPEDLIQGAHEEPFINTDYEIELNENRALLKNWLMQLKEKCRKTLHLWNIGFSMKEIADKVPYKDHMEAAVAKYRCMKKLFGLIDYQQWLKENNK